jgi:dTDP-4-amino-4,6-dideoxygalactose transaminase
VSQGIYGITEMFEKELAKYTGAPYVVAVDSCCSAIFLSLMWMREKMGESIRADPIVIPAHTYMGVPCEIRHAGFKVKFYASEEVLTGQYKLDPLPVYDSALRLTSNMYIPGSFQCLSFTGPYKHIRIGKGGAILHDDPWADVWLRRARYSGRSELPYHVEQQFIQMGWNMYLLPSLAVLGLQQLAGLPLCTKDKSIWYPDLSNSECYTEGQ